MNFIPEFPLSDLTPAPYNPRRITPEAFSELQESLRTLGFIKPVIINEENRLIAGHQRTKAATSIGLSAVPAIRVQSVSLESEVRFNQCHNVTDDDSRTGEVRVEPAEHGGFKVVSGASHAEKCPGAPLRSIMMNLIAKYGAWGSVVATLGGEVLTGQQYAISAATTGTPILAYYVTGAKVEGVRAAFSRQYGAYSYEHLPRVDYMQSMAQIFRLRGTDERHKKTTALRSGLYEHLVTQNRELGVMRILDFGCGQGDYVQALRRAGISILGYEPFYRANGKLAIDTSIVHEMIDALCSELRAKGLFDAVVCDAVLNSVNCRDAELALLRAVGALVRRGGTVYISTRAREGVDLGRYSERSNDKQRQVEFIGQDGYSGYVTNGRWFFQRFHREGELDADVASTIGGVSLSLKDSRTYHRLAVTANKPATDAEYEAALRYEFNLQWPLGRIGRADDVVAAWRAANLIEQARLSTNSGGKVRDPEAEIAAGGK